jgi:uncharacterized membrane protein
MRGGKRFFGWSVAWAAFALAVFASGINRQGIIMGLFSRSADDRSLPATLKAAERSEPGGKLRACSSAASAAATASW